MAKPGRMALRVAASAGGLILLAVAAGMIIERSWREGEDPSVVQEAALTEKQIRARAAQFESRLKALAPRGVYIVIDTAENRLRLMRDGKLAREAIVSCGSGDILEEPDGPRQWIFDTPRGEFFVSSKLVNPTWIKPDWAFIEEGEAIPKNFQERVDNDTLGEYALGFGNGYFIHGTLYSRLLGRNVTHGCVRVGDEDLEAVFRAVPMGAKIFIY